MGSSGEFLNRKKDIVLWWEEYFNKVDKIDVAKRKARFKGANGIEASE